MRLKTKGTRGNLRLGLIYLQKIRFVPITALQGNFQGSIRHQYRIISCAKDDGWKLSKIWGREAETREAQPLINHVKGHMTADLLYKRHCHRARLHTKCRYVLLDKQIYSSSARVGIHDRVAYPTWIMHALPSRAAHTNDIIPMGLVVSTFILGMLECGQSTLHRVSPVEAVDWSRESGASCWNWLSVRVIWRSTKLN